MKHMPSPLSGFLWVFTLATLFGLLVGTLNLLNPDAVHIPFGTDADGNKQSAEGLDGVLASVLSSGALGIFFGILAAFICWIFRGLVKKANDS